MERKSIKLVLASILMLIVSCNEPETVVTDYVHSDGSVTRKIEMKSNEANFNKRFKISEIQVPLDSTWTVKDSVDIDKKRDSIWIRTAVKQFKNVDELNQSYKKDSSANKNVRRQAGFSKRFKWFNTEFRFSERIDKQLSYGYPVKDFLNSEELLYFYSPESLKHDKETGPDSLKFRAFADSIKHKTDLWSTKNIVSEWIGKFSDLIAGRAGKDMTRESLKARQDEFIQVVESNNAKFDSLWQNGIILKELIGEENAVKFRIEADSALGSVTKNFLVDFKDYSVRIVMPGKLIGTNGFIDSSHILLWPVKSDFFMTEPYEMWAESKTPNTWAWIVSGIFLVFVLTGVIVRIIKKG
jgi:hypothetical protein